MARDRKTAKDTILGEIEVDPDQVAITTTVRMPADLRRQLEAAAADQNRNLSQEIERRLRRSLDPTLLGEDAIELALKHVHEDGGKFLRHAMMRYFGPDTGQEGYWVADLLTAVRRMPPGITVHISKTALDRVKGFVREIEKRCAIKEAGSDSSRVTPEMLRARDVMISRIAAGELKPRAPIPKESDLARDLGVSLETLRNALDLLEAEGLLERQTAKGAVDEGDKTKARRRDYDFVVTVH